MWLDTVRAWFSVMGPNPYLRALGIVVATLLFAKAIEWAICRVIGVLARRTQTAFDDQLIALLHRPVLVSVILFGLAIATFELELETTPESVTLGVLKSIAIVIWLVFSIRFSRLVLAILSRHQDRFELVEARTLPLFDNLALLVLVAAAAYLFLLAWNLDPTGWLASAGIIGLALSFAARDTLANLFAGVFIVADAPYKIGDFVILDTGERGRVTRIGIRSTRLLTRDDIEVTIPNAVMGNSKIINESGGPHEKERIRIPIGVAYGSDIDKVREALLGIARQHPEICAEPEPRVRFRRFGESSLDFELLGWIDEPVLRGRMIDVLNCEVYKTFQAEGIEFPYPKRDVYVKELPRGLESTP